MATQPLNESQTVHHLSLKPVSLTPAELLQIALQHHAAIDVIERLSVLCGEERTYQAKVAFDDALTRCQARLSRISADAHNPQTNSKYASYAKLDQVVRPIYTAEDFSLSFSEKDCPTPGKTRFVAYLSRGGFTREYIKDMTPSTTGPERQGRDDADARRSRARFLRQALFAEHRDWRRRHRRQHPRLDVSADGIHSHASRAGTNALLQSGERENSRRVAGMVAIVAVRRAELQAGITARFIMTARVAPTGFAKTGFRFELSEAMRSLRTED